MFRWESDKGKKVWEALRSKLQKMLRKDNLIILVLGGILLLVISLPTGKQKESPEETSVENTQGTMSDRSVQEQEDYAEKLEARLEEILSQVEGAGEVKVMITLRETRELVVEMEETRDWQETREEDSGGGSREIYREQKQENALYTSQKGDGSPLIIKEKYPKVEGAVVLAQGAGRAGIRGELTEAVQALLGLEAHKVKVLKMGHISSENRIQ